MSDARYLLVKGDLYYRPNACGYTGIKEYAGRYTLDEAKRHAIREVSMIHEDEAPEYTKACYADLKDQHMAATITELRKEVSRLRAHIHRLGYAGSQFEALLLPKGKEEPEYRSLHSTTAKAWRKAREEAERAALQGETK